LGGRRGVLGYFGFIGDLFSSHKQPLHEAVVGTPMIHHLPSMIFSF
jgi:hypothetical protein